MPQNLVNFVYVPGEATAAQIAAFDANTIYFVAGENGSAPKIYKGSTVYANAGDLALLRQQIGSLPVDQQYDNLIDYIDSQIAAGDTAIETSLADVATSGAAADVSIADTAGNITATNVEDAIQELYTAIGSGGTDAAVTVTRTAGGQNDDYVYRYMFFQGGNQITNGVIDIAKDMVATEGTLIHPTAQNPIEIDGQQITSGTYIEMTIANGDPFYIDVANLIEYNSVSSTDEITLTDTNHTITATVGEIAASKIIYREADDSDPEHPVAQQTVAQAINALESAIGSGGSVDEKISTAINALDADLDAVTNASVTDTEKVAVMTGVTEVNGVLTAVDSVDVDLAGAATRAKNAVIGASSDAASANTIYGAKAYADAAVEAAALTWGSLS